MEPNIVCRSFHNANQNLSTGIYASPTRIKMREANLNVRQSLVTSLCICSGNPVKNKGLRLNYEYDNI